MESMLSLVTTRFGLFRTNGFVGPLKKSFGQARYDWARSYEIGATEFRFKGFQRNFENSS